MSAEVFNIRDGGFLQEDPRVAAGAAEDDETGEEEEPRDENSKEQKSLPR